MLFCGTIVFWVCLCVLTCVCVWGGWLHASMCSICKAFWVDNLYHLASTWMSWSRFSSRILYEMIHVINLSCQWFQCWCWVSLSVSLSFKLSNLIMSRHCMNGQQYLAQLQTQLSHERQLSSWELAWINTCEFCSYFKRKLIQIVCFYSKYNSQVLPDVFGPVSALWTMTGTLNLINLLFVTCKWLS